MYKKVVIVASAQLTVDRPPPAVAFLAGVCAANNVEYEILDLNLHIRKVLGKKLWSETYVNTSNMKIECAEDSDLMQHINYAAESAVDIILNHGPDLVAITSFSVMQIAWTKKLLSTLKKRSTVTTIGGGPGISYEQENNQTAGKLLADQGLLEYYVLGEGDHVFDSFLKGKIELGVNKAGQPWENWVPQIDNLNSIIMPSYKKVNFSEYQSPLKDNPILSILGSRGCVRRCTFCDIGHLWKKFRFRTADNIIQEMLKHYEETGITNFNFTDSLINGNMKEFSELLKRIIELKKSNLALANLTFTGQFIVREAKHHPERIFQLMKDAGCKNLALGIESGSDAVRFHMGKKFTNEDIDYHMEMSEKYGIENAFLLFIGYPIETLKDHEATMHMIKRYQKYLINNTLLLVSLASPMIIYKNTPIDHMREELGIDIHTDHYENYDWVAKSNPELTLKERYRRYLELVKLCINLRYPRIAEDIVLIDRDIKIVVKSKHNKRENHEC